MYGLRYDAGSIPCTPLRFGSYEGVFSQEKSMHVIAVTGGKGGVGKTNIAVNLGVSMSREGLDVILLDADLGLANVDVILGDGPQRPFDDSVRHYSGIGNGNGNGNEMIAMRWKRALTLPVLIMFHNVRFRL